jgi:arsenate reductase
LDVPADVTVWFNPRCSKARGARDLLTEQGIDLSIYDYLRESPTKAELEAVMVKLGIEDPRAMMRTGEAAYKELDLANADRDELLDAMAGHPILIERPIVIRGDRAVIARPPERALELLVPEPG